MAIDPLLEAPRRILDQVSAVVVGKEETKRLLLVALMAGGHILIEGLPGTAKTLLGRTFAQAIGGEFKRIQLTPDMLPADVTGFNLYRPDGHSEFVPGPIFANVVLADELNRTTPRTQSAFLEAMQEAQVTVEGHTHPLPALFVVVASQIPSGGDGTHPLTDVQTDRFMFRLWSGYPERAEEASILDMIDVLEKPQVSPVVTPEEVLQLRERCRAVHLAAPVRDYILDLVGKARQHPDVLSGPSPRASLSLLKGSRAMALLEGRDFVLPDDIQMLALPSLEHRLRLKPEAEADGVSPRGIVERCLAEVAVPKGGYGG